MADNIKVNRLTNANLYVDGTSHLGKAEEVNLPDIKYKMADHKALGMVGTFELFAGVDKMEASIKWNSFYRDAMTKFADPTQSLSIQVRGSLEEYTSNGRTGQVPVVCYLSGSPKNFPLGNYKQHDNVEATSQMTITYCKLEIDGNEIYEIDVLSNIFKVDGVDILAKYRANIGG